MTYPIQSCLAPFFSVVMYTHMFKKHTKTLYYQLLALLRRASSVQRRTWTQDVHHLLLHLLQDFLEFGVFQHQGPLTGLVVTQQGFVHLSLTAAKRVQTGADEIWNTVSIRPRSGRVSGYLAVAFAVFQWLLFPSDLPREFSISMAVKQKRGEMHEALKRTPHYIMERESQIYQVSCLFCRPTVGSGAPSV